MEDGRKCQSCTEPTRRVSGSAWDRKNGARTEYTCKNTRCDVCLRRMLASQDSGQIARIHAYNEQHNIDIQQIRQFIGEDKRKEYLSRHTGLTKLCLVFMATERVGIRLSTYEDIINAISKYKPRRKGI